MPNDEIEFHCRIMVYPCIVSFEHSCVPKMKDAMYAQAHMAGSLGSNDNWYSDGDIDSRS